MTSDGIAHAREVGVAGGQTCSGGVFIVHSVRPLANAPDRDTTSHAKPESEASGVVRGPDHSKVCMRSLRVLWENFGLE